MPGGSLRHVTRQALPDAPGRELLAVAWVAAALFAATSVPVALGATVLEVPAAVVSLLLFVGGSVVAFWAYLKALGRIHDDTQAWRAIEEASRHFDRINLDLISQLVQ